MAIPPSFVGRISMIGCLCCVVVTAGCGRQPTLESRPTPNAVPYITAKEFSQRLSSAGLPMLVEFSVPAGCYRCDQMSSQIENISTDVEGKVDVYRLNLKFECDLVAQLGIKVCPTYVAFDHGKEVFRVAHPTSGAMLAAKLEKIAATP